MDNRITVKDGFKFGIGLALAHIVMLAIVVTAFVVTGFGAATLVGLLVR